MKISGKAIAEPEIKAIIEELYQKVENKKKLVFLKNDQHCWQRWNNSLESRFNQLC